jgi:hypothetical protein
MRPEEPTKAEIDYLIKERKVIKRIPPVNGEANAHTMKAFVFKRGNPGNSLGLIIKATAKKAIPGLPRPLPSAALVLLRRDARVRGLNYEQWHDNPDGTKVVGWHEHIWTEYGDDLVIPARPKPEEITIHGLFKWGLRKWNIAVVEEQLSVNSNGSKKQNRKGIS